jgi:hypothetical protein
MGCIRRSRMPRSLNILREQLSGLSLPSPLVAASTAMRVTYRIELKADHIAGIRIDGIRVVCKVPAGPDGDGVRLGSLGGDRGACGR